MTNYVHVIVIHPCETSCISLNGAIQHLPFVECTETEIVLRSMVAKRAFVAAVFLADNFNQSQQKAAKHCRQLRVECTSDYDSTTVDRLVSCGPAGCRRQRCILTLIPPT